MGDKQVQFLEAQQAKHPALAGQLEQFSSLYQRKLWHQLTVKLEEALSQPESRNGDFLIPLYEHFIASFALKINLLKLAHIAITIAQQYSEPDDAIQFLERVITQLEESKLPRSDQPILILRATIAQYKLKMGYVQECKALVEAAKESLDSLHDVSMAVLRLHDRSMAKSMAGTECLECCTLPMHLLCWSCDICRRFCACAPCTQLHTYPACRVLCQFPEHLAAGLMQKACKSMHASAGIGMQVCRDPMTAFPCPCGLSPA